MWGSSNSRAKSSSYFVRPRVYYSLSALCSPRKRPARGDGPSPANRVRVDGAPRPGGGPPGDTNGHAKPAAAAQRVRPHEAMQRFPLLQRALDVFQAIPMAIDPGFGEDQPRPAAALPQEPDTEEA